MTEVGQSREARSARKGSGDGRNPVSRLFGSLGLFISQILDELRKVVRPTRSELITYTGVCMVFVAAMMAFISGLDVGLGAIVVRVFGGNG